MKSGLEDRNNKQAVDWADGYTPGLNEVRPGRPEQLENHFVDWGQAAKVSMKSGLEDRNNDLGSDLVEYFYDMSQ